MKGARRTVDAAADALRRSILSGQHPAGSQLPAERGLAEDLGISRLTLRAALARLESEGLVRPKQGRGVEVLAWQRSAGVALLPHLLDHGELELLPQFLTLRRALAAEAVALASERASDEVLDELDVLAQELAREQDPAALMEGNLRFSRRLIDATGNLPMALLFNTVSAIVEARADVAAAISQSPERVRQSFGAIVALLRTRNPDRARTLVREILTAIDQGEI